MPKCSRFLPALAISCVYACIAPAAILFRMGKSGWHWVWNDPAFGFFMVAVFPFAVSVFSCIVDVGLIKRALRHPNRLSITLAIFVLMIIVVGRGVYLDMWDSHRARQPYMFESPERVRQLSQLHDQVFAAKNFETGGKLYRQASATASRRELDARMIWLFMICNFVNVGFAVTVFCYILLAAVDGKISEQVCNHLVFVLAALAVWFPCRAYADWYINLTDLSWISTYAAAWVLAVLLIAACVILALRMVEGSLYHRFVIPTAAVSAVLGAIAALKKPQLLRQVALAIAGFDPVFLAGIALAAIAILFYVSTSVHQKAS